MKTYTLEELKKIVSDHQDWLNNKGGKRADLRSADLRSADLRSADLRSADLRSADLSSANLSFADLSFADLSFADLSSADLRSADLRSANLSFAKTDHRYISINGIGREKRMTIFDLTEDKVFCGCFTGTLKEFEKRVKETHAKNKIFLKEYLGAIKYVRSLL